MISLLIRDYYYVIDIFISRNVADGTLSIRSLLIKGV